jgi:cytochrome P450
MPTTPYASPSEHLTQKSKFLAKKIMSNTKDPFTRQRKEDGVLSCPYNGETVRMLLRHEDVRAAAKDWQTYSSDAPYRVPVPSEEHLRTVRQLPIELDPPEHTEYRKLVEPFFKRAKLPEVEAEVAQLIDELLVAAAQQPTVEIVGEFATVIQSRALACLLNLPQSEADEWITWGFSSLVDNEGNSTGDRLDAYLRSQVKRARETPGEDFFTAMTQAKFKGRPLNDDEILGFSNLTFAGGRDTVIHTISTIMAHLAKHPEILQQLRKTPKLIIGASEEFFRFASPITHIGRVCPHATQVHGELIEADQRVSLGWAAANRDPDVFDSPNEVLLDRKPNPHVAFGFGPHLCLGAAHARMITRTLLKSLSEKVGCMQIVEHTDHVEDEATYTRTVGYDSLVLKIHGR